MLFKSLFGTALVLIALTGCQPEVIAPGASLPDTALKEDPEFKNDPDFGLNVDAAHKEKSAEQIAKETPLVHIKLYNETRSEFGFGAGTIIKYGEKQYVLTAGHLISKYRVIKTFAFFEASEEPPQEIEPISLDTKLDFAIFRFADKNFRYKKEAIRIGSSLPQELPKGSKIFALGSPQGANFAVSEGMVVKRDMGLEQGFSQPRLLLHSAKIDRGSSGGPLVNQYGEFIGVNVMMTTGSERFALAVPIGDISAVLRKLQKTGRKISHPENGLTLTNSNAHSELDLEKINIAQPSRQGIMILKIDSPAAEAGFKKGDIILSYYDKSLKQHIDPKDHNEIGSYLYFYCDVDDEIEFKVDRYGKQLAIKLELTAPE